MGFLILLSLLLRNQQTHDCQLFSDCMIMQNTLQEKLQFYFFDKSHVNDVLRYYKTKPIDGIIGTDILLKEKAIIDYSNHCLYVK